MNNFQKVCMAFMIFVALAALYTCWAALRYRGAVGLMLKNHSTSCVLRAINGTPFLYIINPYHNMTAYFDGRLSNCTLVDIGKMIT